MTYWIGVSGVNFAGIFIQPLSNLGDMVVLIYSVRFLYEIASMFFRCFLKLLQTLHNINIAHVTKGFEYFKTILLIFRRISLMLV